MRGLDDKSRDEILTLFPELAKQDHQYKAAALCLKSFEAGLLG